LAQQGFIRVDSDLGGLTTSGSDRPAVPNRRMHLHSSQVSDRPALPKKTNAPACWTAACWTDAASRRCQT
jgi:hypothetical protein